MANRAELDAWVLAVSPRAVAYARSLLKNPHDAEEIVQDCFCRLLAKEDDYDLVADGQRLLLRSITNACINHRTRRKPFLRLVRDSEHGEVPDDPHDTATRTPDELAAVGELSDALAAGLRQLPVPQRAAVELKALGYSQQEIAEMLEVSTTNAGVLIYRGRAALAKRLAPFLGEEALR